MTLNIIKAWIILSGALYLFGSLYYAYKDLIAYLF